MSRLRVDPYFRWCDLRVGAYWDSVRQTLHVCPVPMFGLRITLLHWCASPPVEDDGA